MKLGEMLVQDGRLEQVQLDLALGEQKKQGGRLGTILVEKGNIDLDTLTVYLGLELGIPIASGATLDRAKRAAVRTLKPDEAARFRCVPIVIHDRQMIVAMDDPLNLSALDELSRLTGYRIVPRVAPEIRIHYFVERYYGVTRPQRFVAQGDEPRKHRDLDDLPFPPLPGLPPKLEEPVSPPTPPPLLKTGASEDAKKVIREDSTLVDELVSDNDDTAEEAPEVSKKKPTPKKTSNAPRISLEEAQKRMDAAKERAEIGQALLQFLSASFSVSMLCVVRDNLAYGWKVLGNELTDERIEPLLIPLERASVMEKAISPENDEKFWSGRPFPSPIHNHIYKTLGTHEPSFAAVFPIRIGKRTVNLLYAQAETVVSNEILAQIQGLVDQAGKAYVDLIKKAKK